MRRILVAVLTAAALSAAMSVVAPAGAQADYTIDNAAAAKIDYHDRWANFYMNNPASSWAGSLVKYVSTYIQTASTCTAGQYLGRNAGNTAWECKAAAPAAVSPSVIGNLVSFGTVTGGQADSGVVAANVVTQAAPATGAGTLPVYAGASRVLSDSLVALTDVPTMPAAGGVGEFVYTAAADKVQSKSGYTAASFEAAGAVSSHAGLATGVHGVGVSTVASAAAHESLPPETPIATGALKPKVAVLLAASLNLVGAFLSTEVAKTISGGIIREDQISSAVVPALIFAGLIGAITWNMITWLLGLPSSSSHALFGGLIGATLVGVGVMAIDFGVVLSKVILPAVVAPLTAGVIAFAVTKLAYALTRRYDGRPDGRDGFRWGQIFTSSLVALAHGTNDAQKTMGVITLALITVGWQSSADADPQLWVIVACALTIALGTYMGGWRIIRTLGKGLTDIKPAQGFAAEASTASTILASSALGFALSTTQVASGSVIGSGLGRRGSTVRWRTVGRIAIGWLLTLPAAGGVAPRRPWWSCGSVRGAS